MVNIVDSEPTSGVMTPLEALKKYWGYDSFRPNQQAIIQTVMGGRDCVALLPTGGGKSLTYQLPAMLLPGITIVVTPLIALMKDQVDALRRRSIQAVAINSSMSYREIDVALDNCVFGDVKLLYVAPERLSTPIFRQRLMRMNVSLVAVDEAHCISQWGYDFRPSYLKISDLRSMLPEVPVLAVTATATSLVLQDIVQYLKLDDARVVRSSFARDNLSFVVRHCENKLEQILRIVNNVGGAGIVYVRTRDDAREVSDFLCSRGVSADFYHAGLSSKQRSHSQMQWMSGTTRVVVATNAFGMGIDKADVRFVIHHQIPQSLEAYYQEAGRAGRDGLRSWAVILYNERDKTAGERRIEMEFPPIDTIRNVYESLYNYVQIPIGGGKGSVMDFELRNFATRFKFFSLTAYNALKILELNEYLTLTDTLDNPTRVMFRVKRDELYKIQVEQMEVEGVLKALLRNYTGLFTGFVPIDEEYLARVSGYTVRGVIDKLMTLSRMKVIRLIPRRTTPLLILDRERLPTRDVVVSGASYTFRRSQSELRMLSMLDYVEQVGGCRSMLLRTYFDDHDPEPCGVCDVCIEHKNGNSAIVPLSDTLDRARQQIVKLLGNTDQQYDLHRLVAELDFGVHLSLVVIRDMLSKAEMVQLLDGCLKYVAQK